MSEQLVPILYVTDAATTARWYTRLGFAVEGEHRFAPELPLYLFLRKDNLAIHLSEHRGDARPNTLLYFYVQDIDVYAKEFVSKIIAQPWAREISLTDPDGNLLRLGQPHQR